MLEPDAGKLARPVLRGERGRKATDLPDSFSPSHGSFRRREEFFDLLLNV